MSGNTAAWFRYAMVREPAVMWSCIIGGAGLLLPLVGMPIRDMFSSTKPIAPPTPTKVAAAMTQKVTGS
eukprot:jgi/Chlat1/1431/Chrsp12S02063